MSEAVVDVASLPIPTRIKQVVSERAAARGEALRREKVQAKRDAKLVARSLAKPSEAGPTLEDDVVAIGLCAKRTYLSLLCDAEVVAAMKQVLTSGEARAMRHVLEALTALIVGEGTAVQTGARQQVIVQNLVPRPGVSA